jgi:hypothetical protein
MKSMTAHNPIDVAWCAGVFEGHGSIGVLYTGPPDHITARISLYLHGEEDVIDRFLAIAGGVITGHGGNERASKTWWTSSSETHAHELLTMFWPYLSEAKVNQATQAGFGSKDCDHDHINPQPLGVSNVR